MTRLHDPARPDHERAEPRPPATSEDDAHERELVAAAAHHVRPHGRPDHSHDLGNGDGRAGYDGATLDPTLPEETPDTPAPDQQPDTIAPPSPDEDGFALQGPRSRLEELRRLFRIFAEFVRGFRELHFVGPCVTVFGSSRTPEDHPDYELAREMGRALARAGFTVMTGGGPGVMEAANRGARDIGGRSVGSGIRLPEMEVPNAYLDTFVEFHYFFVRKVMLMKYSYAFIFLPGGFGTLDEVFEAATLVQTRKIRDFPLIFVNRAHWQPLLDFIADLADQGRVNREDADRFIVTDSPEEAARLCREAAIRRFGLSYGRRERRRWWLFE